MKFYLFSLTCVCMLASCSQSQTTEERYQAKLPTKDTLTDLTDEHPEAPTKVKKLDAEEFLDFVPEGYVVKDWMTGNLNRDDQDDIVIILEEENRTLTADLTEGADGGAGAGGAPQDKYELNEKKRPVMLLTRNRNGELKFARRNDNIVLCTDCGGVMGDPYTGIAIKNGSIGLIVVIGHRLRLPMVQVPVVGFLKLFQRGSIFRIAGLVNQFQRIEVQVIEFFRRFKSVGGIAPVNIFHVFGKNGKGMGGRMAPDVHENQAVVVGCFGLLINLHEIPSVHIFRHRKPGEVQNGRRKIDVAG